MATVYRIYILVHLLVTRYLFLYPPRCICFICRSVSLRPSGIFAEAAMRGNITVISLLIHKSTCLDSILGSAQQA